MNETLNGLIQESSSWKSAIEMNVSQRQSYKVSFIERNEDFYISLFYRLYKSLKEKRYKTEVEKSEILSIAQGLEIYSLESTRHHFSGVNSAENVLYAASIYYLTEYFTSARILAALYKLEDYTNELERFIHGFLVNDLNLDNEYMVLLKSYLELGNQEDLLILSNMLDEREHKSDTYNHVSILLAKNLIEIFKEKNIRNVLLKANAMVDWNKFIKEKIDQMWVFLPSQEEALNKKILTVNKTYSLQMPTSSGKTSLCELIVYNEVKNLNKKVILLAPFRALANELNIFFKEKFINLNITVKAMYGGYLPPYQERTNIENVDLLICTPEKFMALENLFPGLQKTFDTVICDEGHLLDDNHRGLNYELLLSKFKINAEEEGTKFIFLSAIIPNINTINNWLGGNEETLVTSTYRPSELSNGYIIENGRTFNLHITSPNNRFSDYEIENILNVEEDYMYVKESTRRINTYGYDTYKARSVSLALRLISNGTVAIFNPQKGNNGTNGLALEMIKQLETLNFDSPLDYSDRRELADIIDYFNIVFGEESIYTKSVQYGFSIHHGDIPQAIREIIEDAIRSKVISLVICTSTLAEGVNLPIKTMILSSIKRFDFKSGRYIPILNRNIKNVIGRAGRAGKEKEGLIISVNPNEHRYIKEVVREDNIEPVYGYLHKIINEITVDLIRTRILITNEIIEEKDEDFKRLIDSIDKSIVDIIYEEVPLEELRTKVQLLIGETLSYTQANEREKETIIHLYSLRSEKLISYVQEDKLTLLKGSNTSVRMFEDVFRKVDFQDAFWIDEYNIQNEESLNKMLTILFSINHLNYDWINFQEKTNFGVKEEDIKTVISMWIKGKWFNDISKKVGKDTEHILKIMSFINTSVCSVAASVTTIIKGELDKQGLELNKNIENWNVYVENGLNKFISLTLIELGFTERVSNQFLSEWLLFNYPDVNDFSKLLVKRIIKHNANRLDIDMRTLISGLPLKHVESAIRIL